MSRDALAQALDAQALQSTLPLESLAALHVPFDELVGGTATEAAVARAAASAGASSAILIGTSGSGKSSVLAYELGPTSERYPEHLVPVRIPMAYADPAAVAEPADFGRHIVAEITRLRAADRFTDKDRERFARKVADRRRSAAGGRRLGIGASLGLPVVNAQLAAELESGAAEFERRVTPGEVVAALNDLEQLFRDHGAELFLVFDDTDVWLESVREDARRMVTAFLARTSGCCSASSRAVSPSRRMSATSTTTASVTRPISWITASSCRASASRSLPSGPSSLGASRSRSSPGASRISSPTTRSHRWRRCTRQVRWIETCARSSASPRRPSVRCLRNRTVRTSWAPRACSPPPRDGSACDGRLSLLLPDPCPRPSWTGTAMARGRARRAPPEARTPCTPAPATYRPTG